MPLLNFGVDEPSAERAYDTPSSSSLTSITSNEPTPSLESLFGSAKYEPSTEAQAKTLAAQSRYPEVQNPPLGKLLLLGFLGGPNAVNTYAQRFRSAQAEPIVRQIKTDLDKALSKGQLDEAEGILGHMGSLANFSPQALEYTKAYVNLVGEKRKAIEQKNALVDTLLSVPEVQANRQAAKFLTTAKSDDRVTAENVKSALPQFNISTQTAGGIATQTTPQGTIEQKPIIEGVDPKAYTDEHNKALNVLGIKPELDASIRNKVQTNTPLTPAEEFVKTQIDKAQGIATKIAVGKGYSISDEIASGIRADEPYIPQRLGLGGGVNSPAPSIPVPKIPTITAPSKTDKAALIAQIKKSMDDGTIEKNIGLGAINSINAEENKTKTVQIGQPPPITPDISPLAKGAIETAASKAGATTSATNTADRYTKILPASERFLRMDSTGHIDEFANLTAYQRDTNKLAQISQPQEGAQSPIKKFQMFHSAYESFRDKVENLSPSESKELSDILQQAIRSGVKGISLGPIIAALAGRFGGNVGTAVGAGLGQGPHIGLSPALLSEIAIDFETMKTGLSQAAEAIINPSNKENVNVGNVKNVLDSSFTSVSQMLRQLDAVDRIGRSSIAGYLGSFPGAVQKQEYKPLAPYFSKYEQEHIEEIASQTEQQRQGATERAKIRERNKREQAISDEASKANAAAPLNPITNVGPPQGSVPGQSNNPLGFPINTNLPYVPGGSRRVPTFKWDK